MVLRPDVILGVCLATAGLSAQVGWTRLYPTASPPARVAPAFTFDAARARTLLFGGEIVSVGYSNQLWQWNGSNWALSPAVGPSGRTGSAMAFDALRNRVVLFGGYDGNYLQDTWEWDGTSWISRTPASSPVARWSHAMAFDPVRGLTFLFGGEASNQLGDLWQWNGTNWMPQTVFTGNPGARTGTALAFDPNSNAMLLFGGFSTQPLDDTWSWNGQTWQQLQPTNPPYARSNHRMVTDAARRRIVLYGGNPTPDPFTWEWDGADWHCVFVSAPTPRSREGLAYDSARGEVVAHGGTSNNFYWTDTWVYRTPRPASFTPYGQGCPGSAGTPALTAAPYSLPWLGDTFRTRVDAIPAAGAGAVFVTGFAATPAQSLAPFGLPGCASFVTLDSSQFILASGGIAEWSIQIPLTMALAGWSLYQQALVLDPASAGGAVVSNAGTVTVGIR